MSKVPDGANGSSKSKDDGSFITTAEAATMVKLSPRTLEKMRQRGVGPEYFKILNRTWYTREKVLAWLASTIRKSTFDPPNGDTEVPQETSAELGDCHGPGQPPNADGP